MRGWAPNATKVRGAVRQKKARNRSSKFSGRKRWNQVASYRFYTGPIHETSNISRAFLDDITEARWLIRRSSRCNLDPQPHFSTAERGYAPLIFLKCAWNFRNFAQVYKPLVHKERHFYPKRPSWEDTDDEEEEQNQGLLKHTLVWTKFTQNPGNPGGKEPLQE